MTREEMEAERLEQARLLGMSGERELALRAKVERLTRALARISAGQTPAAEIARSALDMEAVL